MMRLVTALLCVFLLVGSAQAVTIDSIKVEGGNGITLGTWAWNGAGWDTVTAGWYLLGVSSAINGPLSNQINGTITPLPLGSYFLYAEPVPGYDTNEALGNDPKLTVGFSDNTFKTAIFAVNGANGSGTSWTWLDGDQLGLGWASATADLVGPLPPTKSPGGNGVQDLTMYASVPLPPTALLLGSGLLGLGLLRRKWGLKK